MSLFFEKNIGFFSKTGLIIGVVACLFACSSVQYNVPISDQSEAPRITSNSHVVQPSETLYSIAWSYGVDHEALASANNIPSPYLIYPKQKLDLSHFKNSAYRSESNNRVLAQNGQKVTKKTVHSSQNTSTLYSNAATKNRKITWYWPAQGKVIKQYTSSGAVNKGIDIEGKLGESVLAASDGKVVYSGSGLRGYGNLIIIKHNEKYLSAYAHNSDLLVTEGESVKAGEKIAEIGSSGSDRNKLHFEIRYQGKPVDPMKYLATR